MNQSSHTAAWERIPQIVSFADRASFTETYGFAGNSGKVNLEGQLLRSSRLASNTIYVFMHPTSTLQLLPMPMALADLGLHVLCAASRYAKNDSALIMEKVAIDLGMWIRHARDTLGYQRVILVGWSGGGSLALFYQAQAEKTDVTQTPAGDPIDLAAEQLLPADGVIFVAAHLSRAETLTEWIDPSVIDELDPERRHLPLDIYSAECPAQPPYTADFIATFRAAQIARNRKITAWCQEHLERLRSLKAGEMERAFVVHRTMCDVRWLDPTVDPNGRKPGRCYMGDPRAVNVGPVGLARYSTLRSWLSQWSYDLSNAKGPANAAKIRHTPVFQIENTADDAVPATHNPAIHAALATPDKRLLRIEGATHYYVGQPDLLKACTDAVVSWSREKRLLLE